MTLTLHLPPIPWALAFTGSLVAVIVGLTLTVLFWGSDGLGCLGILLTRLGAAALALVALAALVKVMFL